MFSFELSPEFIDTFLERTPKFGYVDGAGLSFGEIVFLDKYSRLKPDGTKETWLDVCKRVINGMYSIQKDHCRQNRLPWNGKKAQISARDAFTRLFDMKWSPPGRGLWMMGTSLVNEKKNSAALQNCSFISTSEMNRHNPAYPFAFLMEASMLGIGCGFDTLGANQHMVHKPEGEIDFWQITDDREGWVESVSRLINSYLISHSRPVSFDYSAIRPEGSPIRTFGGVAAGSEPLKHLHRKLHMILSRAAARSKGGAMLQMIDIGDIGNLIGKCVVSGNVRRSAELLLGDLDDADFLALKDASKFPERNFWSDDPADAERVGWGWMSNNSVRANANSDLSSIVGPICLNGEPGVIWMDMARNYGRTGDPPDFRDYRIMGFNPCGEQGLESGECCTLADAYLSRHTDMADFIKTLKCVFLYAKTVTLLPTHWGNTNAIMQRNRRIGLSLSGVTDFLDAAANRMPTLISWLRAGYDAIRNYDRIYSEWLCIRESIRVTTIKPGGTTGLVFGPSAGAHWRTGGQFIYRTMRFPKTSPMVERFIAHNYRVEADVNDPERTVVVYFPIAMPSGIRTEDQVSIFEKAGLAATLQRHWSDNSVSVTVSFNRATEASHVGTILGMYAGQLKSISFLPYEKDCTIYQQAPYIAISEQEYLESSKNLIPFTQEEFAILYRGQTDASGERGCTNDKCEWTPSSLPVVQV